MTIDKWLTLAAIVSATMLAAATLVAPALAEIIKFRLTQPKTKPTAKPKTRHKAPWRGLLGVAISVAVDFVIIANQLRATAPLTRVDVLLISLATAGLVSNLMFVILAKTIDRIVDLIGSTSDVLRSLTDVAEGHTQVLKDIVKK